MNDGDDLSDRLGALAPSKHFHKPAAAGSSIEIHR